MKVIAPRNANVQDQDHRSCFWISMYFWGDVFVFYLQSHIYAFFHTYLISFHLFVLRIAFSAMSTCFPLLVHSNYYSIEWHSDLLLRVSISFLESRLFCKWESHMKTVQMNIIRITNRWISLQAESMRGYRDKINAAR